MSDRKIITINPQLFELSNNKTRKKQPSDGSKPIRIKSNHSIKNKTTKGKLLRYIREQQEGNYQKLFQENNTNVLPPKAMSLDNPLNDTPSNDFENSVAYLKNIEEINKSKIPQYTIKNTKSIEQTIAENANYKPYPTIDQSIGSCNMNTPPIQLIPKTQPLPLPKYGCLKNGNLPTYRTMINQTARVNPVSQLSNIPTPAINNTNYSYSGPPSINTSAGAGANAPPMDANDSSNILTPSYTLKEKLKKEHLYKLLQSEKIKQKTEETKQFAHKIKGLKQKKTIRRTYYTGKSKVFSKVGVLVSNRTIRKQITTQMHLLKQVPIQEIRNYLVKKGLIKIGSTAPNDVLRQMFENSNLIAGEVINHNTENLLFNYMNADDNHI